MTEGQITSDSALFTPRSVAIIGASPNQGTYGGRCLRYYRSFGFQGRVYAVNPRYEEIGSQPCYPNLSSLPHLVDQIVCLVPAPVTLKYIKEAVNLGIPSAVICASGFAESGPEGIDRQLELNALAEAGKMKILGPNSLGYVDLSRGVTSTFTTALEHLSELPQSGPTALVSQSGALAAIIFSVAHDEGYRVGKLLSTGNEASLGIADSITALAEDESVSVVLVYIENLRDGRRVMDAIRHARESNTQTVVLLAGRSDLGRRAALSHTGALTGSHKVAMDAFDRAGIVAVSSVRELIDAGMALTSERRARDANLGIVSGSGGVGVMMADQCAELGISVPRLESKTIDKLNQLLPEYSGMDNPVDYGPIYQDPGAVRGCISAVLDDDGVDIVVLGMALSPSSWGNGVIEEHIRYAYQHSKKPLVVSWLGPPASSVHTLRAAGIPVYEDPSRAMAAANQLINREGVIPYTLEVTQNSRANRVRQNIQSSNTSVLGERAVKSMLAEYGVPVVNDVLTESPEQAVAAAREIGGLVAVKAEADGLIHKSDIGALKLNVSLDNVAETWKCVVEAAESRVGSVRGALIQPMVGDGLEILAGFRHDEAFGPILTVGVGGVFTEVIKDVVTAPVPVTHEAAFQMLDRLKSARLFDHFRGRTARDKTALAATLERLSDFAVDTHTVIEELDCNPIILFAQGSGCLVVDAIAILKDS